MYGNQQGFQGSSTISLAKEPLDARHMQARASKEHQREEELGLSACQQPCQAAAISGEPVRLGELYQALSDVGVTSDLVGVCVMGVVLGNPPAEAQPDQPVRDCQPQQPIGPSGAEDLLVSGIMAEEAQLGEHHA